MKLLSWNMKGLGGMEKRRKVLLLVGEKRPFVFCMQETKMSSCDDSLCYFLWGNPNHGYSFRPLSRVLGRLLTAWDSSEVQELLPISQDHVLLIHGRFIKIDQEFYLFNVYTPSDVRAKQELRASLTVRIQALQGKKVCFCEDFNVVRGVEEKRSVGGYASSPDALSFNNFIDGNELIDFPFCGRRYTWFMGDGISMSRLDRLLLFEERCLHWPHCLQVALLRGISDHYPLKLSVDEKNWGPRRSKKLKCWQDMPDYKQFVSENGNHFMLMGGAVMF